MQKAGHAAGRTSPDSERTSPSVTRQRQPPAKQSGHLTQPAAIMNSLALTQLKEDIQRSPVVQNLVRLGEQIVPNLSGDPVQLMPTGTLAHSDRIDVERDVERHTERDVKREESHEQSSADSSGGCGSA